MAVGRTVPKWWRVYVDGFDWSGWSRTIGPLEIAYDEVDCTAMSDQVKGYLPNHPQVNCGTLNAILDTNQLNPQSYYTGIKRNIMVPIGVRAAPADGDPCFAGQFTTTTPQSSEDGGMVTYNIGFSGWAADATTLQYPQPWGILLHANAVRLEATGVNTAAGFLNYSSMATTTQGGYFAWQVFAGDGTATLSVQDSDDWDDPADYDITVATSGVINCAVPHGGIVAANTLTIREGLRWQIDFDAGGGTATTVTFACAFMRLYNQL